MGSYFGSALCPVDIDMDGTTDLLLVAAPFYHVRTEEGRVYVYRLGKQVGTPPSSPGRWAPGHWALLYFPLPCVTLKGSRQWSHPLPPAEVSLCCQDGLEWSWPTRGKAGTNAQASRLSLSAPSYRL